MLLTIQQENYRHRLIKGNIVVLTYDDGDQVNVSKKDFDRAFGAIINATKEAVIRDFGI